MKVYIVLNEDTPVFASEDGDVAYGMCDCLNAEGTDEEVEASGRDIDDLDEDEIAEFAFINGFNGGYHECVPYDIPVSDITQLENDDTTFNITDSGEVTMTYHELFNLLLDSSENADEFDDDTDDEFEGDFEWDSIE